METFGDFFLTTLWIFFLFMFLMVLFYIFGDIFRDRKMSGWAKAIWILFLIVATPITALIYLIVRGRGLQERTQEAMIDAKKQQDAYIREVSATDPTDQIAKAKELHEAGTITDAEFDQIKAKALA
jgi:ABC-type lipoprotein release transport system permease subunit